MTMQVVAVVAHLTQTAYYRLSRLLLSFFCNDFTQFRAMHCTCVPFVAFEHSLASFLWPILVIR